MTANDLGTVRSSSAVGDGPTVHVRAGAAIDAEEALRLAAKLAATESLTSQVGFLLEHLGGQLTAATLGLSDARQLTKWWFGKSEPKSPVMHERIHLLFQASYAITFAYSGATAAGFLRAGNPDLGDEAPFMLIRNDPTEARVAVLGAVRLLLD